MNIKIDTREIKVYNLLSNIIKNRDLNINLNKESLDLADFIIHNNETDNINYLVERKTLADLLSSIKDGRYEDQSSRLDKCDVKNCNIIYIVEGNISLPGLTEVEKKMIWTSLISITSLKNFSLIRTINIQETCELLLRLYEFSIKQHSNNKDLYTSCGLHSLKKFKKNSAINKENIDLILLSQIPGISAKTADLLLKTFDSFYNLQKLVKESDNPLELLNNKKYLDEKKNKKRKFKKNIINNIIIFLK